MCLKRNLLDDIIYQIKKKNNSLYDNKEKNTRDKIRKSEKSFNERKVNKVDNPHRSRTLVK